MNTIGTKGAKTKARELLARFSVLSWPIDVDYIAQRLGVAVRNLELNSDLSGMIFIQENPTIVINSRHHLHRRRFTLAHEIGHYVLHSADIADNVHVDKKFIALARDPMSSTGFLPLEIEANSFAAELLVPRQSLIEAVGDRVLDIEEDDRLVSELSRQFVVSQQMMSFRIGELLESYTGNMR